VDHFIRGASVRALSSANHWVRDWSCQHLIARGGEFVFDGTNKTELLVEEFDTLKPAAGLLEETS
jgi:hypothetical protein